MRRLMVGLTAVALLGLAGCSDGSGRVTPVPTRAPTVAAAPAALSTPAQAAPTTPVPVEALGTPPPSGKPVDALLQTSDLYGGAWTENGRGDLPAGQDTASACEGTYIPYAIKARSATTFVPTGVALNLSHRVTVFGPGDAARSITDLKGIVEKCPVQNTTEPNGTKVTYSYKPYPLPVLGDESHGMTATVTQPAGTISLTIFQVRRGDAITAILFTSANAPSAADYANFEQLIRRADWRLAGMKLP